MAISTLGESGAASAPRPAKAQVASRRVAPGGVSPTSERPAVKWLLIAIAAIFLLAVLLLPLLTVFLQAFAKGPAIFWAALSDPDGAAAIRLTLTVAAIAVPANLIFGVAAAWAIAKFDFPGKAFLITLIDLPFSVSPVIAGMIYVILFGSSSILAPLLKTLDLQITFAAPGIVLATIFVTFPFVARELIPLMQDQGSGDEEAAISLGANGWQAFWYVTLPNIRWGLLYGVLLCNARAMGEFGAVSVISGHIRGVTNTMPLHIEILYDSYDFAGAFAVASLLALLALITLVVKTILEFRFGAELAAGRRH